MLKQRVLTALVLFAVLALALTIAAPWGFPLLAAVMVVAAMWEWMRLLSFSQQRAIALALAVGCVIAGLALYGPVPANLRNVLLGLSALAWFGLALRLLVSHQFVPTSAYPGTHAALGILLGIACWVGIVAAYELGMVFTISVLALVWAADIAAYFAGRAFGRHKLAPAISPGKTWEGVAGGVLAVWLLALVCTLVPGLETSFFALLFARLPVAVALGLVTLLAGLSVVGDLFESHLKRQAGVKDSSKLLPGHGGVLDRIDAWLPVIPVALLMHYGL